MLVRADSGAPVEIVEDLVDDGFGDESGRFTMLLHMVFAFLEGAGWWGFAGLIIGFTICVCFALPSTPIEIAAGYLYGPIWGTVCGSVSKTAGSTVAFLVGRLLGQRFGYEVPGALADKLSALQDRPFMTMVGIRVAPLPLAVKNYGLA